MANEGKKGEKINNNTDERINKKEQNKNKETDNGGERLVKEEGGETRGD